jgi:transposase
LIQDHPDWVLGFQDETWWSRYETPNLCTWTEQDQRLRLVEQPVPRKETDPKAVACYGLLVSCPARPDDLPEQVWLRFVDGRPVSALTIQYLQWCCDKLEAAGKTALLLIWDNASWHVSRAVRQWIRDHNRQVKQTAKGVRILACYLPSKSPWLNPIEPCWAHAKRNVVEPERTLAAEELMERVRAHFGCARESHLSLPELPT